MARTEAARGDGLAGVETSWVACEGELVVVREVELGGGGDGSWATGNWRRVAAWWASGGAR